MHILKKYALLLPTLAPGLLFAKPYVVDNSRSVLATLTLGGGLGHNHLVISKKHDITLNHTPGKIQSSSFKAIIDVAGLDIDSTPVQKKWWKTYKKLGVIDEPLTEQSKSKQKEIAQNMWSKEQLDLKNHKHIKATLTDLKKSAGKKSADKANGFAFTHTGKLTVTIRGQTVSKRVPVKIEEKQGTLKAKAYATFKFSQFKIETYSAFLGAATVKDPFHIYVKIEGKEK